MLLKLNFGRFGCGWKNKVAVEGVVDVKITWSVKASEGSGQGAQALWPAGPGQRV